jgi:nitrite reductase/ring-hydroxylating ferredoxin subunit
MRAELCKLNAVPEQGAKVVDFFGREALVYRHGDEVRAALSICTHLGGPLELRGNELVCGWHGARFDCASGQCTNGPAHADSRAMFLPTRQEDGALHFVWGE